MPTKPSTATPADSEQFNVADPGWRVDSHPRVKASWERLQGINLQLKNCQDAITAEESRRLNNARLLRHMSEASNLVYGTEMPADAVNVDLDALRSKRDMLNIAVEMARKAHDSVTGEVNAEIVRAVLPHYTELVKRTHAAYAAAAELQEAEVKFRDTLRSGGATHLPNVSLNGGSMRDRLSTLEKEMHYFLGVGVGKYAGRPLEPGSPAGPPLHAAPPTPALMVPELAAWT